MAEATEDPAIDNDGNPGDTLERLRTITKMFTTKANDDDSSQPLKKIERIAPSDKMRNTFQKFEEIASSNGQNDFDDDDDDEQAPDSNGIVRSSRKKKAYRETVPYHEMAEVKDKFEKGLVEEKPRAEKRLDVRVKSGLASSKKQAFEQGEFAQEVEPHVTKVQIDTDLVAGFASAKKQAFEHGNFAQEVESHVNKVQIDADLVAGLTSAKKQAFETHQLENESQLKKTVFVDRDALTGATTEKKAKFEKGEFNQEFHELGSNRVQADANLLVGATTEKKAKFESGLVTEQMTTSTRRDEISTIVETGLAQAKRSELLSKFDAEQQVQRSGDRHIEIDLEQRSAASRRDQLEQLAQSEFKPAEKQIDVTTGLAHTIKEQYMADTSKMPSIKPTATPVNVESGLAKSRATAFEHPDEASIKRTVEVDNEILERGVAKERVAMFKNLQSGAQPSSGPGSIDSKIRVDENGNVVRESDKREEIYFEKGQTKNLVEQWKIKQISPERDTIDAEVLRDAEILQQGKAKNLVEMWKTMDKENTPPPERRGVRALTPSQDNERSLPAAPDNENTPRKPGYSDDKANIESGHAKAIRERLMQTVEQSNSANTRKTLKQVTPPPQSINDLQKSMTSFETPTTSVDITDQYNNNEEIVPTKGQAQSLKNRFAELEKDALKVETASSKIKYIPKRFVDTPAPKQINTDHVVDPSKCSGCEKTVYAMEKIEADKKIYHKSCFKSDK